MKNYAKIFRNILQKSGNLNAGICTNSIPWAFPMCRMYRKHNGHFNLTQNFSSLWSEWTSFLPRSTCLICFCHLLTGIISFNTVSRSNFAKKMDMSLWKCSKLSKQALKLDKLWKDKWNARRLKNCSQIKSIVFVTDLGEKKLFKMISLFVTYNITFVYEDSKQLLYLLNGAVLCVKISWRCR